MQSTRAMMQHRQPMIRFLGKRSAPAHLDHTPRVHPASSADSLPETFASYRQKAQQHGPLGGRQFNTSANPFGGRSGASLGSVRPEAGEFFDREDLPARFQRKPFSMEEIEAIDSAGATMHA